VNIRAPRARATTVAVAGTLLIVTLAVLAVGCASGPSGQTTTTTSGTTAGSSTTGSQSVTTTTLPQMMSEYDKELAKTSTIENQLAAYLSKQQAAQDDPRAAIIFGLRTRVQALTCRKALSNNDLTLADSAMRDVYTTLNLGRNLATGTVAQTLTDARAIIATLGAPSDNPGQAATLLDQFIAALAPLLDEATAIAPATTST
jgi:hypothetical protein